MLIGLLSDAHGNLCSLQQGRDILLGHGAAELFFLGDAVGYIPDTRTVSFLRENGIASVTGNHESMLATADIDAANDEIYQHARTWAAMSALDRAHIRSWPKERRLVFNGVRCLLVHGSPTDPLGGYVYPDTDLKQFEHLEADYVFMGHTHRPFVREHKGVTYVNVGSCGLPRGDDARGAACLFDASARTVQIIRYGIGDACRDVLRNFELEKSVTSALLRCISDIPERRQ